MESRDSHQTGSLRNKYRSKNCFYQPENRQPYGSSYEVEGKTVSEGCVLFCAPKHFEFTDPQLSVEGNGDEIIVKADAFARFVCIESDDPDMLLSDNFFDMNAGESRVKVLRGTPGAVSARSVYDIR